jgi:hypothetical protein
MNRVVAHLLVRIYPRAWRERYGAEFEALLCERSAGVRSTVQASVNVIVSALAERIVPRVGGDMDQPINSFVSIVKRPSAFLPMVMSLIALAVLVSHISISGAVREADEGAIAHIWQILMAGQLPVLVFFAIKWLPRAPRQTAYVLALQAGAALASMAPVFYFNL